MIAAALAVLVFAAAPAPAVRAMPVQDSPILVTVTPPAATKRIVCALDSARPRTCRRSSSLAARPGLHRVRVWTIDRRGRASAKRVVSVVVPAPAPPAVRVGSAPVGIASTDGSLWVSNSSSGTVSRIDPATRRVLANVQIGGQLGGIAASGSAVWVSDFGSGTVVRIDPDHGAVVARIAVGGRPTGIAIDANGTVWATNLDGYVSRIDPAGGRVLGRLTLPSGGSTPLVARGLVWVGLQNGALVAVDPATAALKGTTVTVAQDVDAIVDTSAGLWVSTFSGTAALVDPASRKVKRRLHLSGRGAGIAASGGRVWVSDYDNRYVLELDAATGAIVGAVHTGRQPRESIVDGGVLWVCDQADGTVTPIQVAG